MTSNKLSLLGIAYKAAKVLVGTAACEKGIKERKIKLLIISSRVSERSMQHFGKMCEENGIDIIVTKEPFGKALGKEYILVAGVTDNGFKKALING